jgi:hypothetical protein
VTEEASTAAAVNCRKPLANPLQRGWGPPASSAHYPQQPPAASICPAHPRPLPNLYTLSKSLRTWWCAPRIHRLWTHNQRLESVASVHGLAHHTESTRAHLL